MIVYILVNIFETFLRMSPFPSKTGLIKIGNPDQNSPVFLTCNYYLTVERVKRALRGLNAYLLVANSRGINVWCAAMGGHFRDHDVISVLKTSGIEKLVKHRKVILPQLAASGIEAKVVEERAGWKIAWGPVYAKDIPFFLKNNLEKTPNERKVRFPLIQRLEMALAWAFPISLISVLIIISFWRKAVFPLIFLVWGISFAIFLSFPLYSSWLNSKKKRIGFIFFDFGHGGFSLLLWGIILFALVTYSLLTAHFSWKFFFRWGFISLILILILSLDLRGSTPVLKSGLLKDRWLRVILDRRKCKGTALCEKVCPENCFEVNRKKHSTTMPGVGRCVQCGACIIQCPHGALSFKSPEGKIILPETVRKSRMSLLGKRFQSEE